jgi:anti-sigma factor RsiW
VTCREFADFIADYLNGGLVPDARSRFERHLQLCPNCVRYLDSYRQSVALAKRAFDDEDAHVPNDVPEQLVQAILSAQRRT